MLQNYIKKHSNDSSLNNSQFTPNYDEGRMLIVLFHYSDIIGDKSSTCRRLYRWPEHFTVPLAAISATCRRHFGDIFSLILPQVHYMHNIFYFRFLDISLSLYWSDIFCLIMNNCDILVVMSQVEEPQAKYYY